MVQLFGIFKTFFLQLLLVFDGHKLLELFPSGIVLTYHIASDFIVDMREKLNRLKYCFLILK